MGNTTPSNAEHDRASYPPVDISGIHFTVLLAALANAQRHRGNEPEDVIQPEAVDASFRAFRRTRPGARNSADPEFVTCYLGSPIEVLEESASGPSLIGVYDYDAENGWGLAEQVMEHLLSGEYVDTRHLRADDAPKPRARSRVAMIVLLFVIILFVLVRLF